MPPRTREQQKARYQAFQRVARALVLNPDFLSGNVQVPDHPEVLLTESGAFVEARIWIPESEIREELAKKG